MPKEHIISYSDAICEATVEAMRRDPSVIVIGEGVADPKAIFGTTEGLLAEFGPDRVIETPIAENGLTGIAIGAAMSGLRPILIHQRVEFALLSLEQILNNGAKTHYITQGKNKVPLVIRLIVGRGWGQGPMHSQSLESIFAHIPGLKIIVPSTAQDAKDMLGAAILDDNPVIMIEHRWIHYVTGNVCDNRKIESDPQIALKLEEKYGPYVRRAGKDLTLATYSYPILEALQAADIAEKFGFEVEIVEMRTLRPCKMDALINSVKKTGRLMTMDMGWVPYGVGAELVAEVTSQAFHAMKAPPVRLGLADHPTPSNYILAENYYPNCNDILHAISQLLSVSDDILEEMRIYWQENRPKQPVDVPNPNFKGPF